MDFGLLYENDKGEYVVLNDVRMADIRLASLVYLLVFVSTYCVPIALLGQNKPFPLLYLGHAQMISSATRCVPSSNSSDLCIFRFRFSFGVSSTRTKSNEKSISKNGLICHHYKVSTRVLPNK